MNSQHNTFKHSKLLKCLRCENKDCTESIKISKTRKTITHSHWKKKHAMCIHSSDTMKIQEGNSSGHLNVLHFKKQIECDGMQTWIYIKYIPVMYMIELKNGTYAKQSKYKFMFWVWKDNLIEYIIFYLFWFHL